MVNATYKGKGLVQSCLFYFNSVSMDVDSIYRNTSKFYGDEIMSLHPWRSSMILWMIKTLMTKWDEWHYG